jgi:phosphoserine phosphatase RsbU/P
MVDPLERQSPPRLVGYESWLYQMPCIDSSGDVFVSVPLPKDADDSGESPNRWLIALGDISGKGEIASRLKDALETEVIRLAGITTEPASILKALTSDPGDSTKDRFATLLVVVIDSDRHELTLANAGHVPPLLRRVVRRVESLAEEITGLPLWIDSGWTYESVTMPVGPGEVVVFHSDGVTAVIDHQNQLFDLKSLQRATAQASDGAASVGQSILEAIRHFGQGRAQQDDTTLLCLGRVVPEVKHKRQG